MDVITEYIREVLMNKMLYADNLVLMSESTENLREIFLKWKEIFGSKELKVNLKKIKVMVIDSTGKVIRSKVDSCVKCGKTLMENSVLCTKSCDKWLPGGCAKKKGVISTLATRFV